MKPFVNKKLTKKLIIILIIVAILSGFLPGFAQAKTDTENGGGILEPIEKFVVYLCDKVMQWLQTTFTSTDTLEVGDGTYNFQYSPAIIFSGTVPVFDVNFITPKDEESEQSNDYSKYVKIVMNANYDNSKGNSDSTSFDNASKKEESCFLSEVVPAERTDKKWYVVIHIIGLTKKLECYILNVNIHNLLKDHHM